jgi:hypothetical protein
LRTEFQPKDPSITDVMFLCALQLVVDCALLLHCHQDHTLSHFHTCLDAIYAIAVAQPVIILFVTLYGRPLLLNG